MLAVDLEAKEKFVNVQTTPTNLVKLWTAARRLTEDELIDVRKIPGVAVFSDGKKGFVPNSACLSLWEILNYHNNSIISIYNHKKKDKPPQRNPEDTLKPGLWQDWLKPFQREAVMLKRLRQGGALFAAPGAGKTVMAIAWARAWLDPILVITRGGAKLQWADEVLSMTGEFPMVWLPESERRKKDPTIAQYLETCRQENRQPLIVSSWEMDRQGAEEIIRLCPNLTIVYDEIHRGKTGKRYAWHIGDEDTDFKPQGELLGNRVATAFLLSQHASRRLGTTATPVANRLIDLYGIFSLLEPNCWGMTDTKFGFRHCAGKSGAYGGLDFTGMSNVPELHERMSFIVHDIPFSRSHSELPPKRRNFIRVPLSEQVNADFSTKAELKKLKNTHEKAREEDEALGTAFQINQILLKEASSRVRKYALDRIKMHSETGKGKILVFAGSRKECEKLAEQVARTGVKSWSAHGEDSMAVRHQITKEYMAHPGPAVLTVTWQSFGESLSLHDTDVLIWTMMPWTPRELDQGEGRVYRLGLNRTVLIEYLVAVGTQAEHILEAVFSKLPAVDVVRPDSSLTGFKSDWKKDVDSKSILKGLMARLRAKREAEGETNVSDDWSNNE